MYLKMQYLLLKGMQFSSNIHITQNCNTESVTIVFCGTSSLNVCLRPLHFFYKTFATTRQEHTSVMVT